MVLDHGKVISQGTPEELKNQAGDQVLELRTVDSAQLPLATKIIEAVTSAPVTSDGLVSWVPVNDAAVLPEVVRRLDEQGVAVGELSLRKPSLDEVFLALTGHSAEATDADNDPEGARP